MSEISNAIKQICAEKGLSYEAVLDTIEAALAAAYRKDFGTKSQNIKVNFDPDTAGIKVFDVKTVVEDMPEEENEENEENEEEVRKDTRKDGKKEEKNIKKTAKKEEAKADNQSAGNEAKESHDQAEAEEEEARKFNPKTEIQLSDAKFIKKTAKVDDEIKIELEVPGDFGRMAAQTAKQVIIQKLREAERDMVYNEFKDKEKEVISGVVQRKEGKIILIDLGKTMGILPPEEQIYGEFYKPGSRIKVYVKEVRIGSKGPEIILSRTSDEILKKVFYLEIPEISNGLIEIKAVAREAGSRSKVAVQSESDSVDPIGSCVGQKGARIQTIIAELGGEKIDIIEYDSEPQRFITNALSPAKIIDIDIKEKEKKAVVTVSPDQFSLAIGKNGQNVRLAANLTGWKIDIAEKGKDSDSVQVKHNDIKEDEESIEEVAAEEPPTKEEDKDNNDKTAKGAEKSKKKTSTEDEEGPAEKEEAAASEEDVKADKGEKAKKPAKSKKKESEGKAKSGKEDKAKKKKDDK